MPENTTVMIDSLTKSKLAAVARSHERSMAAQVRYWTDKEYAELLRYKLIAPVSEQDDEEQS